MFYISVEHIILATLAFIRIGGLVFALPVFGDQVVPVRVRIMITAALTLAIFPFAVQHWNVKNLSVTQDVWLLTLVILKELVIGLSVGFAARLTFDAISIAAQVVGYQMGFGTASLFLPSMEGKQTGFSALHHCLIVLIFLALNFHHLYIECIQATFRILPLGSAFPSGAVTKILIDFSSSVLSTGLQLAAPVLIAILFSTAALGLLARAVPQINVFVVSFPVSFYLGLLVYASTIPMMPSWVKTQFSEFPEHFYTTLRALAP